MRVFSPKKNSMHNTKGASSRDQLSAWQCEELCGLLPQRNWGKLKKNPKNIYLKPLQMILRAYNKWRNIYSRKSTDICEELRGSVMFELRLHLHSLLPAEGGGDSTADSCSQDGRAPSPSSQGPRGGGEVTSVFPLLPQLPVAEAKSR